jgi:hypothetical protein
VFLFVFSLYHILTTFSSAQKQKAPKSNLGAFISAESLNYLLASSIATAIGAVIPTMELLPALNQRKRVIRHP